MKQATYLTFFMMPTCICLSFTVKAMESLSYPIVETGQERIGLQANYKDNNDGTISDLSTGLMWVKERSARMPWNDAVAGAKACHVGNYSDWRMPTIKELYSLILFTGNDGLGFNTTEGFIPYINTNYFGFTYGNISKGERVIDCQDWSSTVYLGPDFRGGRKIFGVNFADGRIKGYSDTSPQGGMPHKMVVRYVRGNPKYGMNEFTSNTNGTITDKATGLMWTTDDSQKGLNLAEAEVWIKELNSKKHLGYSDWRLPTAKELHSIVDYTRCPDTSKSAAINPLFNVTKITNEAGQEDYPYYWTSTTHGIKPRPGPSGSAGIYIAFGRAMGFMFGHWTDVHGAGAQRSDPKAGNPANFPKGRGPQGDAIRIYNHVRPVRVPNTSNSLPLPAGIWPTASLIVARTTDTTVDINILPRIDMQGTICHRRLNDTVINKGASITLKSGMPSVIHLNALQSNSRYAYWLECAPAYKSPEYSFTTQRAPGNAFQFIVQGDSHPERGHQNNPVLYAQALKRIALERPDFFIALGDDFSVDTLREITPTAIDNIYRAQRENLGFVGAFSPLFLVNGNHEQAARCNLDGTPNNVAVWAQNTREKYFSQPSPQGIYTGDTEQIAPIGFLRDYYAWQWGDALFVVIDPYWHSPKAVDNALGSRDKTSDAWNSTLGDAQYQWLKKALETSHAAFKFVFTHHVLGRGRGGVECASNSEWGGRSRNGAESFSQKRPGWPMPIHQLLVKNGVTIFFQGHDHLFCKQELDGVIYQTCPLPAGSADSRENFEAYRSGTSVPGSGFLRVSVQPTSVRVDFVKNLLPQDTQYGKDGDIAFSYQVKK